MYLKKKDRPTEAQIRFLKEIGITLPDGVTRKGADALIDHIC